MYDGSETVWKFLFPKFDRKLLIRLTVIGLTAFGVFGFVLMPCFIHGASMEPTYSRLGFNLCNKLAYKLRPLTVGDIVVIRYVGRKFYLKRVVGLPGDTIEFRNGMLYRNGEEADEPYVKYRSDWTLPPRRVAPGDCYVVGDNRGMKMKEHIFGSVSLRRIAGRPLW